ncbi:Cytochrome c [Cupriavidus necator]|uniref:Cytochrome c n=1 Tax=Cupriavidus necator TaxID=106590 RepID=A0A1K0INM3_CUPNE|nr:Cytochrome c [Cupriavidus necator]
MSGPPPQAWLNALLALIEKCQLGLLSLWHALGLTGDSHGQPAWPWAQRIAGETLLIDLGLARQVGLSVCAIGFAVLAVIVALAWRRQRVVLLGAGAMALLVAPWPKASLLLGPAMPTSFHASPTRFSVDAIALGARVYAQHCAGCHGADGRGEGPLAATLAQWPPTLVSPLLARRADGELFWHVLAGMRDRHGRLTMPGLLSQFGDREAWAVIDYMKALSAGSGAGADGNWPVPLRLPEMAIRCGNDAPLALSQWRGGQRVRLVAVDGVEPLPYEDPRFLTVLVTQDGKAPAQVPRFRAGCTATSPHAWQAVASIAGEAPARLAGTQLLADRAGWLRARGAPGRQWSDADLVCVSAPTANTSRNAAPAPDGLTALLLRMDAEPVRFVKGGIVH